MLLYCRSWRASSEQLQWQIADLQRKLKDSEQRSTLWARRAGAAEARVPAQGIAARKPLPRGPSSISPALTQSDRAGLMGRPGAAVGSFKTATGSCGDQMSRLLAEQQQDHEDGCALALLQEALSAAPDVNVESDQSMHNARQDDGMQCPGVYLPPSRMWMSTDAPGPQTELTQYGHVSSLKQRIAEYQTQYQTQNGLAVLQYPSPCGSGDALNCHDEDQSPLQQRMAEYNKILEQQFSLGGH